MPEPNKPIRRMPTPSARVWLARERARARRDARKGYTAMAEEPAAKVDRRKLYLGVWAVVIFLAGLFVPAQYRPALPLINQVGQQVIEQATAPEATPTPTATPVQTGALPLSPNRARPIMATGDEEVTWGFDLNGKLVPTGTARRIGRHLWAYEDN